MFGKKMSPSEQKAKLAALKEAHGMASNMMKDGLDGAKKVSIMADSKQGLEKGLDLAKKIVDKKTPISDAMDESDMQGADGDSDEEGWDSGDSEHEMKHEEDMSEDELDAEIQRLMELKAKLEHK